MSITLVLPSKVAERLHHLASMDVESAAVLLAKPVTSENGNIRLLGCTLREVPDRAYSRREALLLEITSDGYIAALGEAESIGAIPIWLHTHPGKNSSPCASVHDLKVDDQLSDLFRLRANSTYYGSLIFSLDADQLAFTGHLDDGFAKTAIERLIIVGDRISIRYSHLVDSVELPGLFDRNIRAFGGHIQRVLGDLRISIVGCGGTGSAVAEQLIRLGVRNLTLIDPDQLSESNLTRVYGSTASDVGRPKVEMLRDHLRRIALDADIETIQSVVTAEQVARIASNSDILFGCTDDNAGRLVLSRLSIYYLIPLIDCGVILTSDPSNRLDGIFGRITVIHPGSACLVCRGRIDVARAASEMLSPEERKRRADEGYAPALAGVEPAVVTFTTMVAATAVSELLERLTRYGPDEVPSEIVLRVHDREVSTNQQFPRSGHYCDPAAGKLGIGETNPFLEQLWQV